MRASGVRGLIVYCSDYRCSHSVAISGDSWEDDVRLSDIEPRFTCRACGRKGADVRPNFDWEIDARRAKLPLPPIMVSRAYGPSPPPISPSLVIRAYQTTGHQPVAVAHAFIIIDPTTGVVTSANAICGLILTSRGCHCFRR
jgi:hypothetical protein